MGPNYWKAVMIPGYSTSGYLKESFLSFCLYLCVSFSQCHFTVYISLLLFSYWLETSACSSCLCPGMASPYLTLCYFLSQALISLLWSLNFPILYPVFQECINSVHFLQNNSSYLAWQINVTAALRLRIHPQNNQASLGIVEIKSHIWQIQIEGYSINDQYSSQVS